MNEPQSSAPVGSSGRSALRPERRAPQSEPTALPVSQGPGGRFFAHALHEIDFDLLPLYGTTLKAALRKLPPAKPALTPVPIKPIGLTPAPIDPWDSGTRPASPRAEPRVESERIRITSSYLINSSGATQSPQSHEFVAVPPVATPFADTSCLIVSGHITWMAATFSRKRPKQPVAKWSQSLRATPNTLRAIHRHPCRRNRDSAVKRGLCYRLGESTVPTNQTGARDITVRA